MNCALTVTKSAPTPIQTCFIAGLINGIRTIAQTMTGQAINVTGGLVMH